MIKAEGLVKNYGKHRAVDDLSFEFVPGKVYGLLGVNGAGKSTTMNIITGYLAPSSGQVTVEGDDIFKKPEKAKAHIGYLPEIPPLYPDMTVREYLTFAAELKKVKKSAVKDELARVTELAHIEDVADRLIKNLSKGYKQRVGLAQALISDPEIIILDEPTVGLDPRQIIEIRSLIRELGKDHAVVLSSHILSEVQAVCDEIMIISRGRLVASGSPESLESMAGGGSELSLVVKGEKKALAKVLEGFTEVTGTELKPAKDGMTEARLSVDGEDIRERLFYALADARLPVMEMSVSHVSLEDVFLELINNENAGASGASDETGAGDGDGNDESDKSDTPVTDNKEMTDVAGGPPEGGTETPSTDNTVTNEKTGEARD